MHPNAAFRWEDRDAMRAFADSSSHVQADRRGDDRRGHDGTGRRARAPPLVAVAARLP